MTAARCMALTICASGIEPALAASPLPLGDAFYVWNGQHVYVRTRHANLD